MRDEDKSKEQLIEELKKLRQQGSTDITERKLAQQALVEREQLFNHAAQIASLGHFVWDEQENRCIYASKSTPAYMA